MTKLHKEALLYLDAAVKIADPEGKKILEFGSYNVNGSARVFFGGAFSYVGVDVRGGVGVDVIGDAKYYKHKEKVDIVVCTETLEHIAGGIDCIENFARNLKKGGHLILTAAADPRAPHGINGTGVGSEFYKNIDPVLLQREIEKYFSWFRLDYDPKIGDVYAIAKK